MSSLHDVVKNRQHFPKEGCKLVFSQKDLSLASAKPDVKPLHTFTGFAFRSSRHQNGGAERDRTADPLLAKQVLSQLSYSPNHLKHLTDKADRITVIERFR